MLIDLLLKRDVCEGHGEGQTQRSLHEAMNALQSKTILLKCFPSINQINKECQRKFIINCLQMSLVKQDIKQLNNMFTSSRSAPQSDRLSSPNSRPVSPSIQSLQEQIASKDYQLSIKDHQIKQLTDFLNKKNKEEGSSKSVFNDEFIGLQKDLAEKEILNEELGEKVAEMERRVEAMRSESEKNETKLKRMLELETQKNNENQKEIDILNKKITTEKETVSILQKQIEFLESYRVHFKKQQRKIFPAQANNNIKNCQQQINQKDLLIAQLKQKLSQCRQKLLANSDETDNQLEIERQKFHEWSMQIIRNQSKIRKQFRMSIDQRWKSQYKSIDLMSEIDELNDTIFSLQIEIKEKNFAIQKLKRQLKPHSNQVWKGMSQNRINHNTNEKHVIKKDHEMNDKSIKSGKQPFHRAKQSKQTIRQKHSSIKNRRGD